MTDFSLSKCLFVKTRLFWWRCSYNTWRVWYGSFNWINSEDENNCLTNEMIVNSVCRYANFSADHSTDALMHVFYQMTGRTLSFIERRGWIISDQSNVNQDQSVHKGLNVKMCWGCLKVNKSWPMAKTQSWRHLLRDDLYSN